MENENISNGTILYIGTFKMPDKCAAAHRVKSVSKSLRDLGFNVCFFGVGENLMEEQKTEGFSYYNIFDGKKGSLFKEMFQISHIKEYINKTSNVKAIIAYNYPAIALLKLKIFCKKKKIPLIADCTEWFDGKELRSVAKYVKMADSALRMKFAQKHIDGMIGISSYLCDYYKRHLPVVQIPATVDLHLEKYSIDGFEKSEDKKCFIYSGSPCKSKEQLDKVVDAFNEIKDDNVLLQIVGVTKEQYMRIYDNIPNDDNIKFYGLVDHKTSLSMVKKANYVVIIRPVSRVTNAGFPTKFTEAITCGTPVLANATSDLAVYLNGKDNGQIVDIDSLKDVIEKILHNDIRFNVQRDLFDYRNYTDSIKAFLKQVGVECNG